MPLYNERLWGTLNNGEIQIRSLTRTDLDEALDLLESFFDNENVCIGCEINLSKNVEARRELRELCQITAEDGISLVAKANGKIVGFSFNKIQYIPDGNEEPFFIEFRNNRTHSPEAKCLMDFMIAVDSETDVFEKFNFDCVCELMFLATHPDWMRRGIASALAKHTIELTRELSQSIGLEDVAVKLRDKRPHAVTAIYTSVFSQKAGRSTGFQVLNTVSYDRFSFNGKRFDQRINPMHKFCEHVIYVL